MEGKLRMKRGREIRGISPPYPIPLQAVFLCSPQAGVANRDSGINRKHSVKKSSVGVMDIAG